MGLELPNDRRIDELIEFRGLALVDDLWVEPSDRRRGVGRALMLALEAEARSDGIDGVGLDTGLDEGYAAARRLYADLGYVQVTGPFVVSARLSPDATPPVFIEILTIWRKAL